MVLILEVGKYIKLAQMYNCVSTIAHPVDMSWNVVTNHITPCQYSYNYGKNVVPIFLCSDNNLGTVFSDLADYYIIEEVSTEGYRDQN